MVLLVAVYFIDTFHKYGHALLRAIFDLFHSQKSTRSLSGFAAIWLYLNHSKALSKSPLNNLKMVSIP